MIQEIRDDKVQRYGLKAQYISAYGNAIRRDKKILDFANQKIKKNCIFAKC